MDDYDGARFKALCASLGVETFLRTDALGRQEIAIDRDGLNKLIALGVLPEDPSGLPGFQAAVERRRKEQGE